MYCKKFFSVSLLLLCAGVGLAQNAEKENVVRIESGLVQGFDHEGSLGFLGIPYAKVERFMPPMPVDKWDTVMVCDHWGPMTMQPMGREMSKDEMSEDCCVINVWTTDRKAKKPVMLWLHGGGFDSGTSEWDPGMKLAQKDVVSVSINHRLNILGFLDLSACSPKYKYSANVGMMDVVAALKWIRNNIAQFGGDPNNVTVFGESGGGGKVGTLLCMPDAKDLFHKAIILSGTILNVNTKEMSESLGKAVLAELGISNDNIEKIKDVPYKELYAAGQRAMGKSIGTRKPGTPMMWGFGPAPDGEIVMQQPFQPGFAALSDDIPIIIGTTFNELERNWYSRNPSREEAREVLSGLYGEKADEFMEAFSKAYPEYDTPADMLSVDRTFRPYTAVTADACAQSRKAPLYVYLFAWKSPVRGGVLGSGHGYELPFVFHTTDLNLPHIGEETPSVKDLADRMSGAWVHFAQTGKPAVEGLDWKPYTPTEKAILVFNEECSLRYDSDREIVTLMQEIAPEPVPPVRK